MKKLIMAALVTGMGAASANAQITNQRSMFFDNFYIGIQGGVSTPLSFDTMFPLNSSAGLRIGKNLTPVFGVNAEGNVLFNDHSATINGAQRFASKTFATAVYGGLNMTTNFSNMFGLYKGEPRAFEISGIYGVGVAYILGHNGGNNGISPDTDNHEFIAKTGLEFAYNLGSNKAWQIYLEPSVIWNLTNSRTGDELTFDKKHAYLKMALGVNYKFNTTNGTHNFKTYNVGELNDKINNLQADLAKKPKEVIKEVTVHDTVTVEAAAKDIEGEAVIYFTNNSSELSAKAKSILDKIPAGASCVVKGYTDEYGSDELNQKISENRAQAVKKYLESKGLSVSSATGYGENGDIVARVVVVSYDK